MKQFLFIIGDRVTVIGPGYTGNTGVVYNIIKSSGLPDRLVIIGDWDGQQHNFVSGDLRLSSGQFRTGDRLCVKEGCLGQNEVYFFERYGDTGSYFYITDINGKLHECLMSDIRNFFPDRDDKTNFSDDNTCHHDWKIYHGFMHDDEFCTKCKVTRKLSA